MGRTVSSPSPSLPPPSWPSNPPVRCSDLPRRLTRPSCAPPAAQGTRQWILKSRPPSVRVRQPGPTKGRKSTSRRSGKASVGAFRTNKNSLLAHGAEFHGCLSRFRGRARSSSCRSLAERAGMLPIWSCLCRARRERADAGARLQQAAARAHTWRPTRRSRPPSRPASPMRTTATSRRRRRARCPPRPPGLLSPLHSQSSEFRAHTSTGGACDLPKTYLVVLEIEVPKHRRGKLLT